MTRLGPTKADQQDPRSRCGQHPAVSRGIGDVRLVRYRRRIEDHEAGYEPERLHRTQPAGRTASPWRTDIAVSSAMCTAAARRAERATTPAAPGPSPPEAPSESSQRLNRRHPATQRLSPPSCTPRKAPGRVPRSAHQGYGRTRRTDRAPVHSPELVRPKVSGPRAPTGRADPAAGGAVGAPEGDGDATTDSPPGAAAPRDAADSRTAIGASEPSDDPTTAGGRDGTRSLPAGGAGCGGLRMADRPPRLIIYLLRPFPRPPDLPAPRF